MEDPANDGQKSKEVTSAISENELGVPDATLATLSLDIDRKLAAADIVLRPEQRRQVGLVIGQVIEESQFFSGPQPSPAMLKEYEQVCPGWAEKLLQMGIDEQKHRHRCQEEELGQNKSLIALENREATYSLIGLVFGFVVLLVILGIGVYALMNNHEILASTCIGSGLLVGVAKVFVNGKGSKKTSDSQTPTDDSQNASPPPQPSQQKKKRRR